MSVWPPMGHDPILSALQNSWVVRDTYADRMLSCVPLIMCVLVLLVQRSHKPSVHHMLQQSLDEGQNRMGAFWEAAQSREGGTGMQPFCVK